MTPQDANEAITGTVVHAEPIVPAYDPIPGVPGTTLAEQYVNVQRMQAAGEATQNQAKLIMQRMRDAFPGVEQHSAEFFNDALAEMIGLFATQLTQADRRYLFFRWEHCACGNCGAIRGMFLHWFDEDGVEREGAFRSPT